MEASEESTVFDLEGKSIFVAGHAGMVGSALVRRCGAEGLRVIVADRREVDLRVQAQVEMFMAANKPDVVLLAAAKVGGIQANAARPGDFLYDNLMIATNIIEAARICSVKKLLFLGSSCIYPKLAPQPISEDSLLTGALEPTNEWYAIAKIAGLKLCQAYRRQHGCDFITCQPTNLYGPNDNFDLETSHVLPALLRKAHEAKLRDASEFVVWGSGTPRREFLHVDDLADACLHLLRRYSGDDPINIGVGEDLTIAELAQRVAETVGFTGDLVFDRSKPDGTPRKMLDVKRLNALGWQAKIELGDGLQSYYRWFLSHTNF